MRSYNIQHDEIAVDRDGTVWVWDAERRGWSYIVLGGGLTWDVHRELPDLYEPYVQLDEAASAIISGHINQGPTT